MKRKSIIGLVLLLTMAGVSTMLISANKPITYKAIGTIDSYVDAWSAEVISGHWSVQIVDDELEFRATYCELNLDGIVELSPVGSVDIFTLTLTTDDFDIKPHARSSNHVLTFSGMIQHRKVYVKPDWEREIQYQEYDATITITPDTFYEDYEPSGPVDQDWHIVGTTIVIQS